MNDRVWKFQTRFAGAVVVPPTRGPYLGVAEEWLYLAETYAAWNDGFGFGCIEGGGPPRDLLVQDHEDDDNRARV